MLSHLESLENNYLNLNHLIVHILHLQLILLENIVRVNCRQVSLKNNHAIAF